MFVLRKITTMKRTRRTSHASAEKSAADAGGGVQRRMFGGGRRMVDVERILIPATIPMAA